MLRNIRFHEYSRHFTQITREWTEEEDMQYYKNQLQTK